MFASAGALSIQSTADRTGDGVVDGMIIAYNAPDVHIQLDVRSDKLGQNLLPGTYLDTQMSGFEQAGHPGFDFIGGALGSPSITGEFQIVELNVDYSGAQPVVTSLAMSFSFDDHQGPPAWGMVSFNHEGGIERIDELPGGGHDLIRSSVATRLPDNVEDLLLTGANATEGWGNELGNALRGNGAPNVLHGGLGNDTLTGAGGADLFVFDTTPDSATNLDKINGFSAQDKIGLDPTVFASLGGPGALATGEFVASTDARPLDADDFILYNTATGMLYYDPDGNGPAARVKFALLVGAPVIDESVFTVT